MGILSSLGHSANGDPSGERVRRETEEQPVEGERQAKARQLRADGLPPEPRAERWTHEDGSLREEAHEERRLTARGASRTGAPPHGGNPRCGRRRAIRRQCVPAQAGQGAAAVGEGAGAVAGTATGDRSGSAATMARSWRTRVSLAWPCDWPTSHSDGYARSRSARRGGGSGAETPPRGVPSPWRFLPPRSQCSENVRPHHRQRPNANWRWPRDGCSG